MKQYFIAVFYGILSLNIGAQAISVEVDLSTEPSEISPLIYGANEWCNSANIPHTSSRWGGNRLTAYNWETNASNAGSDYIHHSDDYLVQDLPEEQKEIPGIGLTEFHNKFKGRGQYTLGTIQMAGYVSADKNGTVEENQVAPSSRWLPVEFKKPSSLSETPDLNDGKVYMDEFVYAMAEQLGDSENGGVDAWSLDNEPALWPYTHVRIHPQTLNVRSLLDKSIAASSAVKAVDSNTEIFGPATYGWGAMMGLNGGDWDTQYSQNYDWFISAYLDEMKKAGDSEGKRLLDVLDFHWYPEAKGDCRIIIDNCDQLSASQIEARLQAPRALWDPSYIESSWIQDVLAEEPITIIRNVKESIDTYYPGTKIAITEYEYGGHDHYSGGLAQADVLGVFGAEGVYMATLWSDPGTFSTSAFNIYLNYDGQGGKFGNWSVPTTSQNLEKISSFASFSGPADKLHLMLINKSASQETVQLNLGNSSSINLESWHWFGEGNSGNIEQDNSSQINGQNEVSLRPHSVNHLVLSGDFGVNISLNPPHNQHLKKEQVNFSKFGNEIYMSLNSPIRSNSNFSYKIQTIEGKLVGHKQVKLPARVPLPKSKSLLLITLYQGNEALKTQVIPGF